MDPMNKSSMYVQCRYFTFIPFNLLIIIMDYIPFRLCHIISEFSLESIHPGTLGQVALVVDRSLITYNL